MRARVLVGAVCVVLAAGSGAAVVWSFGDQFLIQRDANDHVKVRQAAVLVSDGTLWMLSTSCDHWAPAASPQPDEVRWSINDRFPEDPTRRVTWKAYIPDRQQGWPIRERIGGSLLGIEWIWRETWEFSGRGGVGEGAMLAVPLWMIALAAVGGGWWAVVPVFRRWARARRGACLECGYPRSGAVCPECGAAFVAGGAVRGG